MRNRWGRGKGWIAGVCLVIGLSLWGEAQSSRGITQQQQPASSVAQKEAAMTAHASGTFEVKLEPQAEDKAEGASLGRMHLDKQFHGGLEGSSRGEMLTARTGVEGSAGYVAMERFSGSLDGRSGSFVMQHSGTMTRGVLQQSVTVVPDSGTGQLAGLAGNMTIQITGGKHFYDFAYTLDGSH
jgi:hypothetical protein